MDTSEFEYPLADAQIAQVPSEPRDESRLLRVAGLSDHRFLDLPSLLDPSDLVVINNSRVRQARLQGSKLTSGGNLELLLLEQHEDGASWEALVRPARRIRSGTIVLVGDATVVVTSDPVDGRVTVTSDRDLEELAATHGSMPLPPYIHEPPQDPTRYQTVYADRVGSAAAPTAGLHFTDRVLAGLRAREIEVATVDLHVGLGTFRPISTDKVEDHEMHSERYDIPRRTSEAVARAQSGGRRVVAVGTTVVRALESAAKKGDGRIVAGHDETALFIRPGYEFQVVDALVTNFHVPGSTLVVMVAAFIGAQWRDAYRVASDRGYRFLSFGDAMLAERR